MSAQHVQQLVEDYRPIEVRPCFTRGGRPLGIRPRLGWDGRAGYAIAYEEFLDRRKKHAPEPGRYDLTPLGAACVRNRVLEARAREV